MPCAPVRAAVPLTEACGAKRRTWRGYTASQGRLEGASQLSIGRLHPAWRSAVQRGELSPLPKEEERVFIFQAPKHPMPSPVTWLVVSKFLHRGLCANSCNVVESYVRKRWLPCGYAWRLLFPFATSSRLSESAEARILCWQCPRHGLIVAQKGRLGTCSTAPRFCSLLLTILAGQSSARTCKALLCLGRPLAAWS